MENSLLLEISRIKNLMGVHEFLNESLLNENVGLTKWVRLLQNSEEVFSTTEKATKFLKELDELLPVGKKLTPKYIDDLSTALVNSRKNIQASAISDSLASLVDDAYIKLTKIKSAIEAGQRKNQMNVLFDKRVTEALKNVFDNNVDLQAIYSQSKSEIFNLLDEYRGTSIPLNRQEQIGEFLSEFEKRFDVGDLKLKDYPEFKTYAKIKFEEELEGFINSETSTYAGGAPHSLRDNFNNKPSTDPTKIPKISTNWRFVKNIIRKFQTLLDSSKPIKVSFEDNVALLKNFPPEKIFIEGTSIPTSEFQNLSRAIAYDIDQLDGIEKNARQLWNDLLNEIDDENLKRAIKETLLYGDEKGGNTLFWKAEKIEDYFKELEKRYPTVNLTTKERFAKFLEEYRSLGNLFTSIRKLLIGGISGSWARIKDFMKELKKKLTLKNFLSEIFFGQIRTFKQIGKIFGTKGYGSWKKLAWNLIKQYALLLFYKQVLIIVPIFFSTLVVTIEEKMGINAINDTEKRTFGAMVLDEWIEEMTTITTSDLSPFDFEVTEETINLMRDLIPRLWAIKPDTIESELIMSKNQAFNEYYAGLSKEQKQNLIIGLGESQNVGTDFGRLYLFTKTTFTANQKFFMEKNNLKESDIKKIRDSLITYSDLVVDESGFKEQVKEWKKIIISPEQIKQAFSKDKNVQKASSLVDATLGAVRTKDGEIYEPISLDDYKFNFKKISYKPFYVVGDIVPESATGKIKYQIYFAKDRQEIPQPAELNDIKSINPKGLGSDGLFEDELDAENAVKTLNKQQKVIQDPSPINLQELLQKL
jgi:hypothetical protein